MGMCCISRSWRIRSTPNAAVYPLVKMTRSLSARHLHSRPVSAVFPLVYMQCEARKWFSPKELQLLWKHCPLLTHLPLLYTEAWKAKQLCPLQPCQVVGMRCVTGPSSLQPPTVTILAFEFDLIRSR